jgi:hypothetical protein
MVWRLNSGENILISPSVTATNTETIVEAKTAQNGHDAKSSA